MKPDQNEQQIELLKLLLPPDMFDYFDIIKVSSSGNSIDVFLDEKYKKPKKYEEEKLTSKGFHEAIIISGDRKNMQRSGYCFLPFDIL